MIPLTLVNVEDIKIKKGKRGKENNGKKNKSVNVLTKKSANKKDELIEKLGLKGKKWIEVKKTIIVPVHYDATKVKIDILNRLTARITYGIRLIGELVSDVYGDIDDETLTVLKLSIIEELVKDSDIMEKTGLSSGFIQQCINKVIWTFKSHRKLHKEWEGKIEMAEERLYSARDDKEIEKAEKWLEKLRKREPSRPNWDRKTSCRFDYRTGTVEEGKGKLSRLWINISTLLMVTMISKHHSSEQILTL